ncbi:ABC transporter substrate-binding protein [Haloprofundus marisrubri]|uniref:ABC transporter substrate-binding protein n=1 Tax=Haloprofundus marisrubri TaxID=1514971 RepID=UPI000A669ED4|nr:sugar ABC transporter substrate-binding protein [Haloprofundus marisrubri]
MLGVAGATSLAGCSVSTGGDQNSGDGGGGNSSDNGGGSSSELAQSSTGWGWDIAARSLQDAAETYNEQEGAEISVEELGSDSWEQRFQTAITSGSGAPDFSVVQNFDVTNYASVNGLTDLTSRIDEAGIREDIVETKWGTVSHDDAVYAIPWDIGPTGIYYKRDLYEEAGIDPNSIETWDDFIEAGQQLPDDVAMVNLPQGDMGQTWRMYVRQLGGQAFTDDGAVAIGSEESIRVAQLMKDMSDAGISTRIELWSGSWFTSFAEGTLASLPSAAWMDGTLRAELPDTAGNWGVFKLPAFEPGGNRASNRGGSNMAIPSQISDQSVVNRAFDYCLWAMTTPEVQNTMLEEYGLFPSLTTAYEADIYDQEQEFYDGQPIFRLFAEVATEIQPYNYTVDSPEAQDALETELGRMLDGAKSPEQAMTDAAQTVADRTDRELA